MFNLFRANCHICTRRYFKARLNKYFDNHNQRIYVCEKCVLYAERRAFRK